MITTMSHSRKGQTIETMKDEWLPGVGRRERWVGRMQRVFRAVEILCII